MRIVNLIIHLFQKLHFLNFKRPEQSYPQRLLPQKDSIILDFEKIYNDIKSDFLLRYIDLNEEPIRIEGKLNPAIITTEEQKRFIRYSLNKMPPSEKEDVKFQVPSPDPKILYNLGVPIPKVNQIEFDIIEGRDYFVLLFSDFHNYQERFPKPINGGKQNDSRLFILKIVHTPIIVNYSHCEFVIYVHNEEITNPKPKWVRNIFHLIKSRIIEKAFE